LFFTGEPLGERDATSIIELSPQYYVSSIASASGDQAIVVLNTQYVVQTDFSTKEIRQVGEIPDLSESVYQDGDIVYSIAPLTGAVGALSVTNGTEAWTADLSPGVRGIIALHGKILVADPVNSRITILDPATGRIEQEIPTGCRPWDLTTSNDSVYAVCPDSSEVLRLGSVDLVVAERVTVPTGSTGIFPCGSTVCVLSRWEHLIASVADPSISNGILVRLANPLVASNGPMLAVEGYERLSIFNLDSDQVLRRLTDGDLTALAISSDNHAIFAQNQSLVRVNK
jgi:hypothetical protein